MILTGRSPRPPAGSPIACSMHHLNGGSDVAVSERSRRVRWLTAVRRANGPPPKSGPVAANMAGRESSTRKSYLIWVLTPGGTPLHVDNMAAGRNMRTRLDRRFEMSIRISRCPPFGRESKEQVGRIMATPYADSCDVRTDVGAQRKTSKLLAWTSPCNRRIDASCA